MGQVSTNSVYYALKIFAAGASAVGGAWHPTELLELARQRAGSTESKDYESQRQRLFALVKQAADAARDRVTDWSIPPRRIDFVALPSLQWDSADDLPAGVRWETDSGTITLLAHPNGEFTIRWTDGLNSHRVDCMRQLFEEYAYNWTSVRFETVHPVTAKAMEEEAD